MLTPSLTFGMTGRLRWQAERPRQCHNRGTYRGITCSLAGTSCRKHKNATTRARGLPRETVTLASRETTQVACNMSCIHRPIRGLRWHHSLQLVVFGKRISFFHASEGECSYGDRCKYRHIGVGTSFPEIKV